MILLHGQQSTTADEARKELDALVRQAAITPPLVALIEAIITNNLSGAPQAKAMALLADIKGVYGG